MGLRNFSDALMTKELASNDSHFLNAYGLYLANGGTPEKFQDFTMDDVNIMYTAMMAQHKKDNQEILEGVAEIMLKVLKGGE